MVKTTIHTQASSASTDSDNMCDTLIEEIILRQIDCGYCGYKISGKQASILDQIVVVY